MTPKQFVKAIGAVAAFMAILLAAMSIRSARVQADDDNDESDSNEAKIQRGFEIAPVPLNLEGKNRNLVGLGSYIVNAQGDCNGCHSAGPPTQYVQGHNPFFRSPYFSPPKKENPATYLGGGRVFLIGSTSSIPIVSRNLTPDKTGMPEGGHTLEEFLQIIKTGVDFDHLHPNCSATVTTNCLPPPFNGDLLQVMPWPLYQDMSDHELRAIYEYLSAIPCIEGPPAPNPLHNDCH